MKKILHSVLNGALMLSCSLSLASQTVKWTSTVPDSCFVKNPLITMKPMEGTPDVEILTEKKFQRIDGFGGCFNELGWTTLSALNEADRSSIITDLFSPEGMNFTLGRMPVGANDFSRDWYSYNETDKDFEMKNFSIANDKETLIPFIKAAQKINPHIKIWASPWSPPSWMKYNNHYACKPNPKVNDLKGDLDQNLEGTNMFIVYNN